MIRREILPLAVVLLFTILLVSFILLPLPDLMLSKSAEEASDPARSVAAQAIGEAMFKSFVAMLVLALLAGIAWGIGPGRSRVLDDDGARSKYWYWWLFILISLLIGGYLYGWWFPARTLGVGVGWRRPELFAGVGIISVVAGAILYRATTLFLARPHMRPSIPSGVSHVRRASGGDSSGVTVSSGVSMSTKGEVSGEISLDANLTDGGDR